MNNEILILVDEIALDVYKGAINVLKESYTKWGLILDNIYDSMVFRGDLSVLGNFTEDYMEYFDEKQALGKEFLFVVGDSLDDTLREELNKFPIFNYGYWKIYDIPAHILLIHKDPKTQDYNTILRQSGAKKIFESSYLINNDVLEFIKGQFEGEEKSDTWFTTFKCYPIGGIVSIDTWKSSFYKVYKITQNLHESFYHLIKITMIFWMIPSFFYYNKFYLLGFIFPYINK